MNEIEQWIADEVRAAVNDASTSTDRSEQAKEFRLGPSDIGFCSERVRRMLDRQNPTDEVDWNKAWIGTVLGDGLEDALKRRWPNALTQVELFVELETDTRVFKMPGHADVILPDVGMVLDIKMKNGLVYIRRQETADQGYQFQRHLYALGAHQCGMFGDIPLEDVKVGNIYYDRSGMEPVPHVQIEPFSHDVIREATEWLDGVVYSFLNNEEAQKEPARQVCEAACGFFSICRATDTDVEGLITDAEHLGAIEMYLEGAEMERTGKKMKTQAQVMLNGVEGHTPSHSLRWTLVNGGPVSFNRDSYMRMGLTKRRK